MHRPFQWVKNSTAYTTTTDDRFVPNWKTPTPNAGTSFYTTDSTNGRVTIVQAGTYEFNARVMGRNNGSTDNRTRLTMNLMIDGVAVERDSQYTSRLAANIDEGSVQINGYIHEITGTTTEVGIKISHVGAAVDILEDYARLSIKRLQ